jgi:hypothetical protein
VAVIPYTDAGTRPLYTCRDVRTCMIVIVMHITSDEIWKCFVCRIIINNRSVFLLNLMIIKHIHIHTQTYTNSRTYLPGSDDRTLQHNCCSGDSVSLFSVSLCYKMCIFDSEVKPSCALAQVIDLIRLLDGDLRLLGVIMILLGLSLIIFDGILFDGESYALDSYRW